MAFSTEEREFLKELERAGMPDDLGDWLAGQGPLPSGADLERVKVRTRSRLGSLRRSASRFFGLRVAAAVLALSLVAAVAAGPDRVMAGIQGLLRYVPGFGVQAIEKGPFLAAAQPVIVESGHRRVEVLGLFCDGEQTNVRIRTRDVWFDKVNENHKPYLVDEYGKKYVLSNSWSSDWGGPPWWTEAWLTCEALTGDLRSILLVIPGREELAASITLVEKDSLTELQEAGLAADVQDITVTAVPELRDTEFVVNLLFGVGEGVRLRSVGDCRREGTLPILRDERGKSYELLENHTDSLQFAVVSGDAGRLTLTIPVLVVTEGGKAKVKLPVPRDERPVTVNKTVTLGRYQVTVEKVAKVNGHLRAYVDLGEPGDRTLAHFGLEPFSDLMRRVSGWSSRFDEQTGQMEYLELDLTEIPDWREVTLVLTDPEVQVKGPWEFTIDTAAIMASTEYRPFVNRAETKGMTREEIASLLFNQYLGHFRTAEMVDRLRLNGYRIDKVTVVDNTESGYVSTVSFDVEPAVRNSDWIAGNGMAEGDWITKKFLFVTVVQSDEGYYVSGMGSGPP